MKTKTKKNSQATRSIRIISGKWRRRSLPVIDAEGLRPTGDRVRETLFNWLSPYVGGARCIDLFAGTGALGFEALSRGAEFVQFNEANSTVAKQLGHNLKTLNVSQETYSLQRGDSVQWLKNYEGPAFDIVFLDPPFSDNLWSVCCSLLTTPNLLSAEALIYVESSVETKPITPESWQNFRSLTAGQVHAQLFSLP